MIDSRLVRHPALPRLLASMLCIVWLLVLPACAASGNIHNESNVNSGNTPGFGLPSPEGLKTPSAITPGYFATGDGFVPEWSSQHAAAGDRRSIVLSPQYEAGSGFSDLAFTLYSLQTTGLAHGSMLEVELMQGSMGDNLWVGLGNHVQNIWEWQAFPEGGQIALAGGHFDAGNNVLVALVATGTAPVEIRSLHLNVELPSPHDEITAGGSEIGGGLTMSRVALRGGEMEPICWGTQRATGGDKLSLQRTLPVPGFAGYYGNGRVLAWAGHAGFFGTGADGNFDNDLVRQQAWQWLLNGNTGIGFTSTHGEWNKVAIIAGNTASWMDADGISRENLGVEATYEALEAYGLLVVGNPWGELTDSEVDAIENWVLDGGSVFVMGLGWSYYQYNDDPTGENYGVNKLGLRFGFEAMNGSLNDPDAPNENAGQPTFSVLPLSEYNPAEVIVLRTSETDVNTVKELAVSEPVNVYVIEGTYMGIQLATEQWVDLGSPVDALAILDQSYLTHMDLVDNVAPPFGGEIVWYITKDDPVGAYWMHSGNPVVMKYGAAAESSNAFNDNAYPGWGMLHEQGHNMVISACGNLFTHSGTGEEWCNVFTVWNIAQNGWPERTGSYDAGHDYHNQAMPDFSELTGSSWILLGCLELVWDKYGWAGMQAFFGQAAADRAGGMGAGDDAARTAYFTEQLSHAYEIDFADLIAHWGFPVTQATRDITAQYDPADIPW